MIYNNTPKHYEIQTGPAPTNRNPKQSPWREKFESMDVGNWFTVDKSDVNRLRMACVKYLKGGYSVRKNSDPSYPDTYIMEKTK